MRVGLKITDYNLYIQSKPIVKVILIIKQMCFKLPFCQKIFYFHSLFLHLVCIEIFLKTVCRRHLLRQLQSSYRRELRERLPTNIFIFRFPFVSISKQKNDLSFVSPNTWSIITTLVLLMEFYLIVWTSILRSTAVL